MAEAITIKKYAAMDPFPELWGVKRGSEVYFPVLWVLEKLDLDIECKHQTLLVKYSEPTPDRKQLSDFIKNSKEFFAFYDVNRVQTIKHFFTTKTLGDLLKKECPEFAKVYSNFLLGAPTKNIQIVDVVEIDDDNVEMDVDNDSNSDNDAIEIHNDKGKEEELPEHQQQEDLQQQEYLQQVMAAMKAPGNKTKLENVPLPFLPQVAPEMMDQLSNMLLQRLLSSPLTTEISKVVSKDVIQSIESLFEKMIRENALKQLNSTMEFKRQVEEQLESDIAQRRQENEQEMQAAREENERRMKAMRIKAYQTAYNEAQGEVQRKYAAGFSQDSVVPREAAHKTNVQPVSLKRPLSLNIAQKTFKAARAPTRETQVNTLMDTFNQNPQHEAKRAKLQQPENRRLDFTQQSVDL